MEIDRHFLRKPNKLSGVAAGEREKDSLSQPRTGVLAIDDGQEHPSQQTAPQQSNLESTILPAAVASSISGKKKQFVYIKTSVWKKDSHMLFDYENTDTRDSIFKIKSSGTLQLLGESIHFVRTKQQQQQQQQQQQHSINKLDEQSLAKPVPVDLFKLHRTEEGKFFLQQHVGGGGGGSEPSSEASTVARPMNPTNSWVVVKSVQNLRKKGFRLLEGDFIKLGRLKLRVREICPQGKLVNQRIRKIIEENTEAPSDQEGGTDVMRSTLKTSDSTNKQQAVAPLNRRPSSCFTPMCKICLSEEGESDEEGDNPLVNPCKCTGSMKFVHIKCIQQWVKSKMSSSTSSMSRSDACTVLLAKFFECELCKTKYQLKFLSEGRTFDIVEYSKPEDGAPHLIIEAYTGSRLQLFGAFILRLSDRRDFTIGRSQDTDVRVSDISVSRIHAIISYDAENNAVYLKDNDSKFGTLALLRDHLEISPLVDKIQIQNGRTIAEIHFQAQDNPATGMFSGCFSTSYEQPLHIHDAYSEPENSSDDGGQHQAEEDRREAAAAVAARQREEASCDTQLNEN